MPKTNLKVVPVDKSMWLTRPYVRRNGRVIWPWKMSKSQRQVVEALSGPEYFDADLLDVVLEERTLRANARVTHG